MSDAAKTTEQLLAEIAELRRRITAMEEMLRGQRDLGVALSLAGDLEQALNHLMDAVVRVEAVGGCGIYLVDRETGALDLVCTKGLSSRFVAAVCHYDRGTPQAEVVQRGNPVHGRPGDFGEAADPVIEEEGLRALAVIPVSNQGEVVGSLYAASRTHDAIPLRARHALEAIAMQMGRLLGRVRAEAALRESRKNLQTLFDTLDDFIFVLDADGRILHASASVARRLGYACEALLGTLLADVHVPDRRDEVRSLLSGARGRKLAVCVVPLLARDGTVVHAETKITRGRWNGRPVLFGVSRDMTERVRAAEAIRREQQLLRQLLDLHDRDRKVIAYEIHDGLSQQLAGALMCFEAYWQVGDRSSPEARERFERALRLLRDSVNETRRLISGLRPLILDESGIVEAVEYLVCEAQERWGRPIELVHEVRPARLAPPLETAIFRIVQESLANACRHSGSERIRVTLTDRDGLIRLEVQDWGKGFEPEGVEPGHFGLQGIRERVRLLGGRATLQSTPGQGTRVLVELPAVEAAAEQPTPR